MTEAARKVLEDCLGAIEEIADGVQGNVWRRRWITAIVLLRTVGYVLDKVDSKRSDAYERAIKSAWMDLNRTKPNPVIFWEFIDKQRHNIIKEYQVGASQGVTVYLSQNTPSDYHYLVNAGPFEGRDQREVLKEAAKWWESYLDGIDSSARS